jgi:hypothetical protein
MTLLARFAGAAAALCLVPLPLSAAPVAGFAARVPTAVQGPAAPVLPVCQDEKRYDDDYGEGDGGGDGEGEGEGGGEGEGEFFFGLAPAQPLAPVPVDCEGSGATYNKAGPGVTAIILATIKAGTEHCGQYTDVWRIDCISDELTRMAAKMPQLPEYRRAKAEVLAAAAELRALAAANADPAQPPVRRAATVDGKRRTTTRPIVAVRPDRVVAVNRQAEAVVTELATTLLRSAPASPTTSRELMRVAQAVDSAKVLLRST